MRFAIDDINAKGGIKVGNDSYRLEAVTADDKSTSEGGREGANRLVLAEKVAFITGSLGSPTAGAQTVTEPAKVAMFAYSATDKSLGTSFPLTFNSGSHVLMRNAAALDGVKKERPGVARVGVILPDDATGAAYGEPMAQIAKSRGLTVVDTELYPADLKDFSPLVTRLLRQKPDVIDAEFGGRAPLLLAAMKALNEQGYKGPSYTSSGDLAALREGAAFMEGYTVGTLGDRNADMQTKFEKDMFQRYVQKYAESELEPVAIVSYNAVLLMAQAWEKAGTVQDAAKIATVLRENDWNTIWSEKWGRSRFIGAKTFGLPAVPEQPVYLSGVRGGKVVVIDAVKGTLP